MRWETIKSFGLYFSLLFLASTSFAQSTQPLPLTESLKQKIKDKIENPDQSGYFGFHIGSKTNTYQSTPTNIELKTFDPQKVQMSLYQLQCSTMNVGFKAPNLNIPLPQLNRYVPSISISQVEQIIDKKALQTYFNQQFSQFAGLEKEWQPYLNDIQSIINRNFNSLVDIPAISQQLLTYIQDNDLFNLLSHDMGQLANIDWSSFSINDYIHQDQLQNLLNQFSNQFNLDQLSANAFLNQSQVMLDHQLHQSMNQSLAALYQSGFAIKNNTLYFTNPSNPNDRFTLSGNLNSSSASCTLNAGSNASGTFTANAGNFLSVQGNFHLNTQQLGSSFQESTQNSVNQIMGLLNQALQGDVPLDQLLGQMQTLIQSIPAQQASALLSRIEGELDSDFSITLNLKALSDGFQGSGNYQFVDIVLETPGHDVGTLTINKQQIMEISRLMAKGNQSEVGMYIFENIAGYSTDKIGYSVVRDVSNTFLASHVQGSIIPLQFRDGGLIQMNQTFYAAAKIKEWKNGRLMLTGSYNERSFNNTPLLKKDGYLHLRTELQSNSLGIAYLPKLWTYGPTKTRVDGLIHLEGLFVHAKSASVLTKTSLAPDSPESVVELYRVPLEEIEGADKTYPLPMISAGFNVEQQLTPGLSMNGFLVFYPGLKNSGSLEEMPKTITAKYASGFSLIIDLESQKNKKAPANHR